MLLLWLAGSISSCDPDDEATLVVDPEEVEFGAEGGSITININTSEDKWTISNPVSDWLEVSETEGTGNNARVSLNVSSRTMTARSGTLVIAAGKARPVEVVVSQSASDYLNVISADKSSISFTDQGGSKTLLVTTNASSWRVAEATAWLQITPENGGNGTTSVTVTALQHTGSDSRTATIQLTATNAAPLEITVTQSKPLYPSYNVSPLQPDAVGMASNAMELAAKIKIGWNAGNAMEAIGGETAWGSPKLTKTLIDLVKQNGFNAIRIPCSWNQYVENNATAKIKTSWLDRVREVVSYCVDNDMYVILNIHWDGGWLENNCTPEKQDENNAKQKAFWEQIATHLRDFDEHLLFAGANEPNVDNATQMAVLNAYHQTFIDAVRSTGGKNSYRVLVVQGPSTDIEKTNNLMNTLPVDPVENRMMVEVHYYTPYNFCLMPKDESWGKMFYYWGSGHHNAADPERNPTYGEEAIVDANFKLMKDKFVDKGIPVVLGEYAVIRRLNLAPADVEKHLAARAYYLEYVTSRAKANGLIPFYWDAGDTGNHGTWLFDRNTNAVFDNQALEALLAGAE